MNIRTKKGTKKLRSGVLRGHGLAIVMIMIIGVQMFQNFQTQGKLQVLGYATNISITELLNQTNQNRASNGLSNLTLNGQLNSAAQNKANHMIANNYWSHYAPDGTSPWDFVNWSGYAYQKAGENLAYGFSTSSGVIVGWMNSPSHAANILDGSYQEVGFAFADGESFQGGENTVVVAMYAQPTYVEPEPVPEPIQQTQQATPQQQQPAQQTPAPIATEPDPEPVAEEIADTGGIEDDVRIIESQYTLTRLDEDASIDGVNGRPPAPSSDTITNLEILVSGDAPTSMYVTMSALLVVTTIYFIRHMRAIYQIIVHGEHYVVGHPLLEASIIYAALWLLLVGTYGVVQ